MLKNNSLEWYPEYTVDLGAYDAPPVADLSQNWNSNWRVYQRSLAYGMVLVNPGTKAVTIKLGGTYELVTGSGGGAVLSNGSQPGSLSTSTVTTVKIPAHSARVLLYCFRAWCHRGGSAADDGGNALESLRPIRLGGGTLPAR
jgi:hypothetical protein